VAKPTFDELKEKLDLACASLREFTLGHGRVTRKRGLLAMKTVEDVCNRLAEFPATSFAGRKVTTLIAVGRGRIKAAEARLALLDKLR